MDKFKLKKYIEKNGYTQRSLACEIGINENTLRMKMNNASFGIVEVEKIAKILDLTNDEIMDIFFDHFVA